MRRVLIGFGTSVGNILAAAGEFCEYLSFTQALKPVRPCDEIVFILPSGKRLAGVEFGAGGERLLHSINGAAKRVIAVSSLDVYPVRSLPFDEDFPVPGLGTAFTGCRYRAYRASFESNLLKLGGSQVTILRLADAIGPGFRVWQDHLQPRGDGTGLNRVAIRQWYPAHRLSRDIAVARYLKAPVVNLCSAPVPMERVLARLFPGETGVVRMPAPYSRIRTKYGEAFGGGNGYTLTVEAAIGEIARAIALVKAGSVLPAHSGKTWAKRSGSLSRPQNQSMPEAAWTP